MKMCAAFILFSMTGCSPSTPQKPFAPPQEFADYWSQGKAEITRYDLEQARYGELHKGNAVIVFVTEDFLKDKQVKLENYTDESRAHSLSVLKMNFISHFPTGIYAYSPMTSVFSPVDIAGYPHSLKLVNSVQEWCGQVYTQFNYGGGHFHVESHSYFEKEGDEEFTLDAAWLEDELWTRIRIDPASLPLGNVRIIPGAIASRFLHRKLAVETAEASLRELTVDRGHKGPILSYTIDYRTYARKLILNFTKDFPHTITSFEGIYVDGFGANAKELHTVGIKAESIMLDYWTHNRNADSTYRRMLGLE